MKQTIYYSDAHSSEFSVQEYAYFDAVGQSTLGELISIRNHSGISTLFFSTSEQIDEFCELLNEKKKQIWKQI